MKFEEVKACLRARNVELDAAELHGLVTGWLCAGAVPSEAAGALPEWIGEEISDNELSKMISGLADATLLDLRDFELGFRLLLPSDDDSITERQKSLSNWCSGFLAGFGTTGRYLQKELSEDVAEVFGDMTRIASLDEEIPDNDANESDLMEISEYIRMSALFVFTECANKAIH
ncbi:MAG: hypothetical protein ACI9FB_003625 [Candidatus Azotimanducaceae bacterium]|jgi:uncharacterized protein YgfB (UPF0149 family)